jgi:hypothetical protein
MDWFWDLLASSAASIFVGLVVGQVISTLLLGRVRRVIAALNKRTRHLTAELNKLTQEAASLGAIVSALSEDEQTSAETTATISIRLGDILAQANRIEGEIAQIRKEYADLQQKHPWVFRIVGFFSFVSNRENPVSAEASNVSV